ncbi:MAG: HlyD family secretion protein [Gemmataceae bacterium]
MKYLWRHKMILGMVGVCVLVVSLAGAHQVLNHPHGSGTEGTANASPRPHATPERFVVCFGYVDVEGGVASLFPRQAGQVQRIYVQEADMNSDVIPAGKVLLSLDKRHAEAVMKQAEADLEAAQAQLEMAQKGTAQQRLREEQQQAAIQVARSRVQAAQAILDRQQELFAASSRNKHEIEAAAAKLDEAKAGLDAELKKLDELRLNDPQLTLRQAQAAVNAKQGQLEQARLALEHCDLVAPFPGMVLRILTTEGELIGPQMREPAIQFCPARQRIVRAEVEQEFASRVDVGMKALIRDDTVAGPEWEGEVVRLSDWFTHRRSLSLEPLQFNDVRTMECIIALKDTNAPLRIGQRVRARIVP